MSYVNLPPEAPFMRLERVMKNQKRLLVMNLAATVLFATSLVASLATLL